MEDRLDEDACPGPNGKGRPHNPGVTSCGRMCPNPGEHNGAVAVSIILSRPVPQGQLVDGSAGVGASGYRCATPTG